ncbi:carboxypeptidase B-like isoform X2 [Panulirus ornatus]|uniref:carboxypeptidase B-like isoform X2 n=1 Tax=Panulirus ornatus TaxID=150431 RepID=UPI003A8A563A
MMWRWQHWMVVLLVTVAAVSGNNYEGLAGHQIWSLESELAVELVDQLQAQGLLDVVAHTERTRTVRVTPEFASLVQKELHGAGHNYSVKVEDLAKHLQKEKDEKTRQIHRAESCTATSCPFPLTYSYMTFQQMEWYLKELAKNPWVEVRSIGRSILDRDIWMVHIKSGECKGRKELYPNRCRRRASSKPMAVWLEGGIHAREWISPAVTLQLIHQITKDCCVTQDLDVYVVPMANPDGYVYSWTTDRFWRKNRRSNSGSTCDGVDLNRNWDYHFGVGASDEPCSQVYKGTKAFSEPETQALRDAMLQVASKGNLKLMIAFHSYGQVLMYPWGWTADKAPDQQDMVRLGKSFVMKAKSNYGTHYRVINAANDFYFASGSTDDWSKGVLKTKYVYTLELRDEGGHGFDLPATKILPNSMEVLAGLKAVFRKIISKKRTTNTVVL